MGKNRTSRRRHADVDQRHYRDKSSRVLSRGKTLASWLAECGGSCSSQRDQTATISCSRPCFDIQKFNIGRSAHSMLFRSLHTQTLLEPSPPRPPAGGIRTQCSSVRMKAFFSSFLLVFPFPSEARRTQRDRHRLCLDMTSTYIDKVTGRCPAVPKRIHHRPTTSVRYSGDRPPGRLQAPHTAVSAASAGKNQHQFVMATHCLANP